MAHEGNYSTTVGNVVQLDQIQGDCLALAILTLLSSSLVWKCLSIWPLWLYFRPLFLPDNTIALCTPPSCCNHFFPFTHLMAAACLSSAGPTSHSKHPCSLLLMGSNSFWFQPLCLFAINRARADLFPIVVFSHTQHRQLEGKGISVMDNDYLLHF